MKIDARVWDWERDESVKFFFRSYIHVISCRVCEVAVKIWSQSLKNYWKTPTLSEFIHFSILFKIGLQYVLILIRILCVLDSYLQWILVPFGESMLDMLPLWIRCCVIFNFLYQFPKNSSLFLWYLNVLTKHLMELLFCIYSNLNADLVIKFYFVLKYYLLMLKFGLVEHCTLTSLTWAC